MNLILLVQFIGSIAFLILLHEIGHFVAAQLVDIKIEEFGLGFPPRIAKLFTWKKVEYSLNWLPLGGFVRPNIDPDNPNSLNRATPWRRLIFLLAGSTMNLLAGVVIYSMIFVRIGEPIFDQVIVLNVDENSPAAAAQLQPGDLLLSVNDEAVTSTSGLHTSIYAHLDEEIAITYEREEQTFITTMVPRGNPPEGEGAIGIMMGNPSQPIGAGQAVLSGFNAVWQHSKMLFQLPFRLLSGSADPDQGRLVGYKGMYDLFANFREIDQAMPSNAPAGLNTLNFLASITISLAVLNLLPIPALDGGRILMLLPEILFKKRVPEVYENMINLVGFALMILLLIYINLQDFINPIAAP